MSRFTMYSVYILHSETIDRYYVGYTSNIVRRLEEHNRKKGKYTDAGIPWILVYSEAYESKQEAMDREEFIKSRKSKVYIQELIAQQ